MPGKVGKVFSDVVEMNIGYCYFNFVLPNDGGKGPTMKVGDFNPRIATDESKASFKRLIESTGGGLIRDNLDYSISIGIDPDWITNLDEVKAAMTKGNPVPRLAYREGTHAKIAYLLNGNHRVQYMLHIWRPLIAKYQSAIKWMEENGSKPRNTASLKKAWEEKIYEAALYKQKIEETCTFPSKVFDYST